jgi:hypothetical protein
MPPKKFAGKHRDRMMVLAVAEKAITGMTATAIARELGWRPATVRRVMKREDYPAALDDLVKERRSRVVMQLEVMSALALKVHMDLMQDPQSRDRLGAAESVLDRAGFGRMQKVQQTVRADVTQATTLQVLPDFQGRTAEDLEYYAKHGHFPGE